MTPRPSRGRIYRPREVIDGSLLHIATELHEIGRMSIRFTHRMYDSEANVEVASTDLVGVYFDTERRSSVELPDRARENAEALRLTSDDSGRTAPRAHSAAEESDQRSEENDDRRGDGPLDW